MTPFAAPSVAWNSGDTSDVSHCGDTNTGVVVGLLQLPSACTNAVSITVLMAGEKRVSAPSMTTVGGVSECAPPTVRLATATTPLACVSNSNSQLNVSPVPLYRAVVDTPYRRPRGTRGMAIGATVVPQTTHSSSSTTGTASRVGATAAGGMNGK